MGIYIYKIAPRENLGSTIVSMKEAAEERGETLNRVYLSKEVYANEMAEIREHVPDWQNISSIADIEVCVIDIESILGECTDNLYPNDTYKLKSLEKRIEELEEAFGELKEGWKRID